MAGMTGAAIGQETLGFIVERAGWRTGMVACGLFSAFLLVLIVVFVRNKVCIGGAGDTAWPKAAEIGRLLICRPILSRAVAGGLVAAAGVAFGMLWGVSYFQAYHQMSLSAASVCASFYFWGCLPGFIGSAWLCARIGRPALLLAGGAAGTAVAMGLILFVLHGRFALSAAMFLLGVFAAFYALSFTMVKDKAPEELSGAALGLTNMAIMGIGGVILQPLIGVLAHIRGQEVPDATSLSVTVIAPILALAVLAGIGLRQARRTG